MVKLGKSSLTKQDLIGVIKPAMEAGADAEAIADMVAERISDVVDLDDAATLLAEALGAEQPSEDEGVVIYDELPLGLIDLPSASRKYGIAVSTIRNWVNRGHLHKKGLRKAPAQGGGYIAVDERALQSHIANRKVKGGRPKKAKIN